MAEAEKHWDPRCGLLAFRSWVGILSQLQDTVGRIFFIALLPFQLPKISLNFHPLPPKSPVSQSPLPDWGQRHEAGPQDPLSNPGVWAL